MKTLLTLCFCLFLFSCQQKESIPEERSVGFLTSIPDTKWHIGTEAAIQIVKDLDGVWAKNDYAAMRPFFADTAKFYFSNGTVANSPDEFLTYLKKENEGVVSTWTFDAAFSVDLNPTIGGEHVNAGFTVTSTKDGVTTKSNYRESYYVVSGKIVGWSQFKQDIKAEEIK